MTTRYGLSPHTGGWDKPGDSGTDNLMGCFGNKLTTASCALTVIMEAALAATLAGMLDNRLMFDSNNQIIPGRLKPFTLLKIVWPGTILIQYRTFDDRVPVEPNDPITPRLDLFYPWRDDPSIPDFGEVSVV